MSQTTVYYRLKYQVGWYFIYKYIFVFSNSVAASSKL